MRLISREIKSTKTKFNRTLGRVLKPAHARLKKLESELEKHPKAQPPLTDIGVRYH